MSEKETKLLTSLKANEDVSNVEVVFEDNNEDRFRQAGNFEYQNFYFSFVCSEAEPIIVAELSILFTYESLIVGNEIDIYRTVDIFNSKSIGMKASIVEINREKKELAIEFSYGILIDIDACKDRLLDLDAALIILRRIPQKLSIELKERKIEHDYLDDDDDNEE